MLGYVCILSIWQPYWPLVDGDVQAICTEAGLLALRERRMKVTTEDFKKAKENVLYRKNEGTPDGLYLWISRLSAPLTDCSPAHLKFLGDGAVSSKLLALLLFEMACVNIALG